MVVGWKIEELDIHDIFAVTASLRRVHTVWTLTIQQVGYGSGKRVPSTLHLFVELWNRSCQGATLVEPAGGTLYQRWRRSTWLMK